jgi:flagellar biosynthesis component FlhA
MEKCRDWKHWIPRLGCMLYGLKNLKKDQAKSLGDTVLDAYTALAAHLNSILQSHCHEIFGHAGVA